MKRKLSDTGRWLFVAAMIVLYLASLAIGAEPPAEQQFTTLAAVTNSDGRDVPPGVYSCDNTIRLNRDAAAIESEGYQPWVRHRAVAESLGCVILYTGPAEYPAIEITAAGLRVEGLNVWRCFYAERGEPVDELYHTGTAIEIKYGGGHDFRSIGTAGFETAWKFSKSNHRDLMTFTNIHDNSSWVTIDCDEPQSSACDWRGLFIHGDGHTVIDSVGGAWQFSTLALTMPRRLLNYTGGANNGRLGILNLKVDSNAEGWTFGTLRGAFDVEVTGRIGTKATMGATPLTIRKVPPTATWKPPADYQRLSVDLWGPNPKGGAVWQPTIEEHAR